MLTSLNTPIWYYTMYYTWIDISYVCTRGLVWRAIIDNEGSLRIFSGTWHRKLTMRHIYDVLNDSELMTHYFRDMMNPYSVLQACTIVHY
jgi:hypothetical protein